MYLYFRVAKKRVKTAYLQVKLFFKGCEFVHMFTPKKAVPVVEGVVLCGSAKQETPANGHKKSLPFEAR